LLWLIVPMSHSFALPLLLLAAIVLSSASISILRERHELDAESLTMEATIGMAVLCAGFAFAIQRHGLVFTLAGIALCVPGYINVWKNLNIKSNRIMVWVSTIPLLIYYGSMN